MNKKNSTCYDIDTCLGYIVLNLNPKFKASGGFGLLWILLEYFNNIIFFTMGRGLVRAY